MKLLESIATALLTVIIPTTASAASLQQVANFGPNPSGAQMYIYVPDALPAKPALIVGVHWCHGNAQAYYQGTNFASKAQKHGYIVVYPSAVTPDGCWDVSSNATLTHLGGGDSLAIHSMVQYTIKRYKIDTSRIFVAGTSSGAMMTQVLLGAYPNIFKAGSGFAGVPFGCFSGPNTWNSDCAEGKITKTAREWGDLVRNAYPGYKGPRPSLQIFHGSNDEVLSYHNFGESIKQWTNVLDISDVPTSAETNVPQNGWTRWRYGGTKLEAVREEGLPHNLVVLPDESLRFFGFQVSNSS